VEARVKLGDTASTYFIPSEVEEQKRCMTSWNKLYGYSRCFGSLHHDDSDRFVWRRAQSCLDYQGKIVEEKSDCDESGKIELAAYAYDKGLKPFQHQGTLLKQFDTLIDIETYYRYRLTFNDDST